jgi:hypothetical protein
VKDESVILFFVFIFVDVFIEAVEVVGFEGCAWLGEVEAVGRGLDGVDDVGGVGFDGKAAGVVAGELETVEQSDGSFGFELAGGEGVDDDGKSDLDGFAVFEGSELDVLAGDEIAPGSFSLPEGAVALMEPLVEVAPVALNEGGRFAAGSVGLDVAT